MERETQYRENPKEREHYAEKGLSVLRFLEGVTEIGAYAFGECRGITHMILPKSLQVIGSHAFYNCRSLHTVCFLGTVPELADGAFKNCDGVRFIELLTAEERKLRLNAILSELEQEVSVRLVFASGEEARLCLPRTSYAFVANEPARMFTEETYGSGIYYRQCVGRSEIDWKRYDELFPMACREESMQTVLSIVRQRLAYPYCLSADAKDRYWGYMEKNMEAILQEIAKTEDWSLLAFLCDSKRVTRRQAEFGVSIANAKERPYMAGYLLDYGKKTFAAAERRLEL